VLLARVHVGVRVPWRRGPSVRQRCDPPPTVEGAREVRVVGVAEREGDLEDRRACGLQEDGGLAEPIGPEELLEAEPFLRQSTLQRPDAQTERLGGPGDPQMAVRGNERSDHAPHGDRG